MSRTIKYKGKYLTTKLQVPANEGLEWRVVFLDDDFTDVQHFHNEEDAICFVVHLNNRYETAIQWWDGDRWESDTDQLLDALISQAAAFNRFGASLQHTATAFVQLSRAIRR